MRGGAVNELNEYEVEVLATMFEGAVDRLRHYEDGEMGWDEKDMEVFWEMREKLYKRARELDCWWAK